jgi:hypothetical protein
MLRCLVLHDAVSGWLMQPIDCGTICRKRILAEVAVSLVKDTVQVFVGETQQIRETHKESRFFWPRWTQEYILRSRHNLIGRFILFAVVYFSAFMLKPSSVLTIVKVC